MTRLRLFSGWRWINNNGEGSVGAMPSKVVRERYLRMKMLSCREKVTGPGTEADQGKALSDYI